METDSIQKNIVPAFDRNASFQTLLSRNRDCIMGIAILLVVACHAEFRIPIWRILYPLFDVQQLLYVGVDLFFFLSGFGVCRSLDRNPGAAVFLKKRLKRIYPIYLPLAVIWAVAWKLLVPGIKGNSIAGILTGLGFWAQLPYQFMWFVSAILVFYLLSPYLHAALRGKMNVHLAFVLLLLMSLTLVLPTLYGGLLIASTRLPVYILGMYFYIAFDRKKRGNIVYEIALYIIMAVALNRQFYMFKTMDDGTMYYHGLFNLPLFFVVPGACLLLARLADLFRKCFLRFSVRFCESLGRVSLELCLIHFLVFQVARELIEFNNWIRLALIVGSILLSMCYGALMRRITSGGKQRPSAADGTVEESSENAEINASAPQVPVE